MAGDLVGGRMTINARVTDALAVRVLSADGEVFPGFDFADFDLIRHADSVDHAARWRSDTETPAAWSPRSWRSPVDPKRAPDG